MYSSGQRFSWVFSVCLANQSAAFRRALGPCNLAYSHFFVVMHGLNVCARDVLGLWLLWPCGASPTALVGSGKLFSRAAPRYQRTHNS